MAAQLQAADTGLTLKVYVLITTVGADSSETYSK
jgi:hypothetical protein